MATLQHYLDQDSSEEAGEAEEEKNISQLVYDTTKVVSPILLPMLKSIGEIEI
ncbi:hypothetical protein RZN22_07800 [Bacillaceae bacterium S4-13-58]